MKLKCSWNFIIATIILLVLFVGSMYHGITYIINI